MIIMLFAKIIKLQFCCKRKSS